MSLVPILYTTLLIFVFFALVVVSISYVSYKVRQRSLHDDEDYNNSNSNTYYDQSNVNNQPRNYSQNNQNSIKVVSTIKKPELRKTVELPYYHSYPQNDYSSRDSRYNPGRENSYTGEKQYRDRQKTATRHSVYEEDNYANEAKSYQYTPRTRTNPGQDRIVILNKTPQKKTEEDNSKERYNSSGSGHVAVPKYFAGFQAINYYSEEEKDAFFKASQNTIN